eukprot:scaffold1350_cov249-Pinguiococcus_pyrenoidosus.AAC.20
MAPTMRRRSKRRAPLRTIVPSNHEPDNAEAPEKISGSKRSKVSNWEGSVVREGHRQRTVKAEREKTVESRAQTKRARREVTPDERNVENGPVSTPKRAAKKSSSRAAIDWADEYKDDILQHWKDTEGSRAVKPYMSAQRDIDARMRAILVNWLVEVHMRFGLQPRTIFMAVHIIDLYCINTAVARCRLQLVGITALFMACKYEEKTSPEIQDFVYITDNAYSAEEVLEMEVCMFHRCAPRTRIGSSIGHQPHSLLLCFEPRLHHRLCFPTAFEFYVAFAEAAGLDPKGTNLAYYLVERTLQEHDMLVYRPSKIAAAGVFVALLAENGNPARAWTSHMERITGYSYRGIKDCVGQMLTAANSVSRSKSRQLVAVKTKFESEEFLEVSKLPLPVWEKASPSPTEVPNAST